MVEDAAGVLVREPVQLVWVTEQVEHGEQRGTAGVEVGALGLVELPSQARSIVADAAEPFGDLVFGPVWVADEVEVLIFLGVELGELGLELRAALLVDRRVIGERGIEGCGDAGAETGREGDGGVVPFDGRLNGGDGQVREVARVVLASSADVVEVQITALALTAHDHEPPLAAVTPHGALEVVVVHAGPGAAASLAVEHLLDPVEERLSDQWLMPSGVLNALEVHVAEVVAAAQKAPELGDRDLVACRMLPRRAHPQSGVGEHGDQVVEAVGAGGIQFERHPDERAAFGIDHDRTDLASLVLLADVEVADRRPSDRAPAGYLLAHLVTDVGAGRAGLVLVHRVEHRAHQVSHGSVLGEVGDRDENGSGGAEVAFGDGRVDRVAVHTGAGVDDHVVNIALGLDPGHHLLKLRPGLDLGRRAPRLHVLIDDFSAELGGAMSCGHALSRDGETFRVVVGVHLPA